MDSAVQGVVAVRAAAVVAKVRVQAVGKVRARDREVVNHDRA